MAAVACLRVMVDRNRTALPEETLGRLVAKFAGAFLEARWSWPREAVQLNHYCYLLSDPRADKLDTIELARLSNELQERLFGTGAEDAIKLLLFEGSSEAIAIFAGYSVEEVGRAIDDPGGLPVGGCLRRIAADGTLVDVPETPIFGHLSNADRPPTLERTQGIYFTARETFVGDVLSCTPADAETHYSLADGEKHLPAIPRDFDEACITAALRFLIEHDVTAPLHLPISFSTLMRPAQRADYLALLRVLPEATRRHLAAAVYDVPRSPSFQALKTVHEALDKHFFAIDLRTSDPGFEIGQLAQKAANSVTLVLGCGGPEIRLATLRRFASRAPDYKRRKIWSAVANIRSRGELNLAVSLGVPLISGPGVCRLQKALLGSHHWPLTQLPVLSEIDM